VRLQIQVRVNLRDVVIGTSPPRISGGRSTTITSGNAVRALSVTNGLSVSMTTSSMFGHSHSVWMMW
jgi:hypothetical protein